MVSTARKKVTVISFSDWTIKKGLAEAHLDSLPWGRIIFVLSAVFSIKNLKKSYGTHTIKQKPTQSSVSDDYTYL